MQLHNPSENNKIVLQQQPQDLKQSLAVSATSPSTLPRPASQAVEPVRVSSVPFVKTTPAHDDKPRPFSNLSNSCYINAGVMACFGVQAFREILSNVYTTRKRRLDAHLLTAAVNPALNIDLRIKEKEDPRSIHEERLAVTFKATFEPKTGQPLVPRLFTNMFYDHEDHTQEDVMEFLLRSVLNSGERHAPLLGNACRGIDAPRLECKQCTYHRGAAPEAFNMLPIPVRKNDGSLISSVQEALTAYFEVEDVCVDPGCLNNTCALYNMPKCRLNKFHRVSVHPQVLVLQLVRWQGAGAGLLHTVVPEQKITLQGERYHLKSLICHVGNTINGGHYTCRIHFPAAGGTWWYYNDAVRRLATEADMRTSEREKSYVLMYERCNVHAPGISGPTTRLQNEQRAVNLLDVSPDAGTRACERPAPASGNAASSSDLNPSEPPMLQHKRPRIVTGFGSERVEDVAADEAKRVEAGARRGTQRRESGDRGRMRDINDNDLDRSAGAAWHAGKRK